MKLTVVGTGYVGLVTGACLAEMGNEVTCVDIDAAKIERLRQGILPIYEPGLESIVIGNTKEGRLKFTTSLKEPSAKSQLFLIAVGTPPGEDGSADLQFVLAVAKEVGQTITEYCVIVDKSTVPVGTAEKVRDVIQGELDKRKSKVSFDVVSNPEFLKEGDAVQDFMRPDRIIIGSDSERARAILRELYAPFMRTHERVIFMGIRDAEMTKYAANAMLATKISFMNEVANLCDRLGVDVENVRIGIGSDTRIGYSFIYPGIGYGGSCFPKDVRALIYMAARADMDPKILSAVEARNQSQHRVLYEKMDAHFHGKLQGLEVGLWGLAFKPGTDDMREAPAVVLLRQLIAAGVKVKAYDPVAMAAARRDLPRDWFESGQLRLVEHQYEAVEAVDALMLVTEWKPFRHPDFVRMKQIMRLAVIFDGRNQYDPRSMRDAGFTYYGIGR
ncbi:MAG: UDP-glucose 6-dehydrogenase [Candidatus Muproteobacteria bacterium RBG_16_60_9]|uniref:UDP-glucose 6-dehydrogenase n=1 Tax=Candidatus Muproteobacteria bacterium RBG_16_60_9 TaxID=1817755 RepID=A0A1F6VBV1_9PROT|nr:MAG: UDP-glucose 6-dehydrogenase [Candidatus Muproteobacteria bacterium RBG_16_60_9]